MKTAIILSVFLCLSLACNQSNAAEHATVKKIRIAFQQQEVLVAMFDNPASRDFMRLLPLTLEFRDFASAEKIANLPRRLNTADSPTPKNASGDFTYYAPWGNLAIFYKGSASDGQLYILGQIMSGKDKLAGMKSPFTATIELVE